MYSFGLRRRPGGHRPEIGDRRVLVITERLTMIPFVYQALPSWFFHRCLVCLEYVSKGLWQIGLKVQEVTFRLDPSFFPWDVRLGLVVFFGFSFRRLDERFEMTETEANSLSLVGKQGIR